MGDLYTKFKNIWARMQTTAILDSLVVLADELGEFEEFFAIWYPGYEVGVPDTTTTTGPVQQILSVPRIVVSKMEYLEINVH